MRSAGRVRRTKRQREYMAKLRDPRWQKRKNEVLARDGYHCAWCRAGVDHGRNLQVHHGYYDRSIENPWEYPEGSLWTLCEYCHEQAEVLRQQVYEVLGYLAPQYHHHVFDGLQELLEALKRGEEVEALEAWRPAK